MGHIELPVPVFNPVFFSVMYKVGCVNIKLILIELNIHFGNERKMSAVFICTMQHVCHTFSVSEYVLFNAK